MPIARSALRTGCAIAAIATCAAVHAGSTEIREHVNAAGPCQGALPAFAGTLRARPLALQNEGDATAFVTCSLTGGYPATGRRVTMVQLLLVNHSGATVPVTCTLVDGAADAVVDYATFTKDVPTWGEYFYLYHPNAQSMDHPNVSCALPPGIGVAKLLMYYDLPLTDRP